MRWQAAQQAGLTQVPVVVREADDRRRRHCPGGKFVTPHLNPIEERRALRRLREEFGLTQEQLAELGISVIGDQPGAGFAEPGPGSAGADRGRITGSGARQGAAGLVGRSANCWRNRRFRDGWSVRELERRRALLVETQPFALPTVRDPDLARLEERLRERLAAPVRLRYDADGGRGRIEIGFSSLDECDGFSGAAGAAGIGWLNG